jgi:hypothetical protein
MSGMFQRIARRHADRPDDPAEATTHAQQSADAPDTSAADTPQTPPAAAPQTPPAATQQTPRADAPTERIEAVASAHETEQPTAYQPAVTPPAAPPAAAQQSAGQAAAQASTPESPAAAQPAANVPPPVIALSAPASGSSPNAADATTVAAAPVAGDDATPAPQPTARRPGFRARGRMRRRLRYLRKLRELQVRDLGGLVFDLRRFERKRDDLVAQKIDHIRACDDELRALELALNERRDVRDVREPGIGGTCPRCFAVFGSADHFCATCGAALGGAVQGPAQVPPAPAPATTQPAAPAAPPPASGSGPQQ